ncbi:hypothetical protein [Nocardia sp. NPDC052566]|uniref:hypothetical protein n=1 Tax=Nocardia sp. NPDC052566 TaxID=3364330 RepID=UPI0037C756BA
MNRAHRHFAATCLAAAVVTACGRDDPEPTPPAPTTVNLTAAPTGVRWQRFQGVNLPVTDQGPHHTDGPAATGYDHTPAGAAIAAIQATIRMSVATDTQWAQIGHRMLASGAGRDAWATARAQISITTPAADGAPTVLGYQITHYTDTAVDIAIYSALSDSSRTRNNTHVVWQADDWRLQLTAEPATNRVEAITDLPAGVVALPAA